MTYKLGPSYGLKLNGLWLSTEARDSANLIQTARVTLKEDIPVPASSQVILPGKARPGEQKFGSRFLLTKSLPDSDIECVLVRHVLTDSADHTVPDTDDVVPFMAKSMVSNTSLEHPGIKWTPASPRMKATVLGGKVAGHQADYSFPGSSHCSWCLWLPYSTAGVWGCVLIKKPAQWPGKQAPRVAFPGMGVCRGERRSQEASSQLQDGCGDPGGTETTPPDPPPPGTGTYLA